MAETKKTKVTPDGIEKEHKDLGSWSDLPADIARKIFVEFGDQSGIISQVCKKWNAIMKDDQIWKPICLRRWPSLSLLKSDAQVVWQQLYKARHCRFSSVGAAPQIKKASEKFVKTQKKRDLQHLQRVVDKIRQATLISGFVGQRSKNETENFFLDSVCYKEIVIVDDAFKPDIVTEHQHEISGTIMSLSGEIVPFYHKGTWRSSAYDWYRDPENRIEVGAAKLSLEIPDTTPNTHYDRKKGKVEAATIKDVEEFVEKVRTILGMDDKVTLKRVWMLLGSLMVSTDCADHYLSNLGVKFASWPWSSVKFSKDNDDDDYHRYRDDDDNDDNDDDRERSRSRSESPPLTEPSKSSQSADSDREPESPEAVPPAKRRKSSRQ